MKKNDAVKFFGSKANLASFIGINRSAVSKWADFVPTVWAYRIEKLTNGELKANDPWLDDRAA